MVMEVILYSLQSHQLAEAQVLASTLLLEAESVLMVALAVVALELRELEQQDKAIMAELTLAATYQLVVAAALLAQEVMAVPLLVVQVVQELHQALQEQQHSMQAVVVALAIMVVALAVAQVAQAVVVLE
jgi:hypothetical protein